MTLDTKRLFDAIRAIKGAALTQADVDAVNAVLVEKARSLASPEAFFAGMRKVTGSLDQQQVDIVNRLLSATSHWGVGWLAYGLATAWHEAQLKPVEEWGKGAGKAYGKINSTGKAPYGRGLVQLTWHANYERADKELVLNGALVKNYDLALDPHIAVQILVRGMEKGWFTGKSMGSYIGAGRGAVKEFTEARRIINGTDKAAMIAGYAEKLQDALAAGGWA